MKKYAEFLVTLVVLLAAVAAGLWVLVVSIGRGGNFFGEASDSTEETAGKTPAKQNSTKKSKNDKASSDEELALVTGTLFIGDSRFVGMDEAVDIESEDHQFVVAKVGQGLPWFKDTALSSIEKIRQRNTGLTHWRYVVCLGVNDLRDIDGYLSAYDDIIADSDNELILVSVNPVQNYPSITNSSIEKFNAKLENYAEENGLQYIDSFNHLMDEGYTTTDGLHYDNDTYEEIYSYIEKELSDPD